MKHSAFLNQFPQFRYMLGLSSNTPDPTVVFRKPQSFTRDPTKIQKIHILEKQYDQELWNARYSASTKSGLLGGIPSLGLAFGAGSLRSYVTERLDKILKMKLEERQASRFARMLPKSIENFYRKYPHGSKLALGVALPLLGATIGAGMGIALKPYLYSIKYKTELDKLNKKYFNKLKTIL